MDSTNTVSEVSAGGFVVSSANPKLICLMARFNRGGKLEWCIPKGHPEQNETIEQAAIREVFEETGLVAKITQPLGEVNYQFIQNGTRISKTVHVFLMKQTGGDLSMEHDPHNEASELEWVPSSKLLSRLSHSNERRIAKLALEIIEAPN